MDFKNFIDVLATPKNLGTNKWVLNNFSDLKSSNDYLHIIRLRYDNRWLRTYWDGKLKEVEKDFNFYVSTPIKGKLFYQDSTLTSKINLLSTNQSFTPLTSNLRSKTPLGSTEFHDIYERKHKDSLGEGTIKAKLISNDFNSLHHPTPNKYNLDSLYFEYTNTRKYFQKIRKTW
jgi:hypothetical protein